MYCLHVLHCLSCNACAPCTALHCMYCMYMIHVFVGKKLSLCNKSNFPISISLQSKVVEFVLFLKIWRKKDLLRYSFKQKCIEAALQLNEILKFNKIICFSIFRIVYRILKNLEPTSLLRIFFLWIYFFLNLHFVINSTGQGVASISLVQYNTYQGIRVLLYNIIHTQVFRLPTVPTLHSTGLMDYNEEGKKQNSIRDINSCCQNTLQT